MTSLQRLMAKLTELRPGSRFQVEWFLQTEILEPDAEALLNMGKLYGGSGSRVVKMQLSRCHDNSVKLCTKNKGWVWMHGFALSANDPCWRIHSWCTNTKGRIIETTLPRVAYYGLPMQAHPAFVARMMELAGKQSR